jgi:hypothetical protein
MKTKENIFMIKAHKNRIPKEMKEIFMQAWRNQEGLCLLSDTLLKKSSSILGIYETPDKDKFDGQETIPFLVSWNFNNHDKETIHKYVDELFKELYNFSSTEFEKETFVEVKENDSQS